MQILMGFGGDRMGNLREKLGNLSCQLSKLKTHAEFLVFTGCFWLLGLGCASLKNDSHQKAFTAKSPTQIQIQAHRGGAGEVAENTLAAFQYAIDLDVDVLELDLQVTQDNQLVVLHDQKLTARICKMPQSRNEIFVRSLTLKEVQTYKCSGKRIPTLQDVFDLVKASKKPQIEMNIETKIVPFYPERSAGPDEFAKILVQKINENNLQKQVIVQSFEHQVLKAIKKLNPQIRTAALTYGHRQDYVRLLKASSADILSPHFEWITKEDVQQLHAAGFQVVPWTVNKEHEWKVLLDFGVDGIITDVPSQLKKFLAAH